MRVLKPIYNVLYYVLYVLFTWPVRLLYPLRVLGRQHLPRGQGYVLAPNHLLAIDPMYIILARGYAKKMLVMGKEELFGISGLLNLFWRIVGVFAVRRGAGDRHLLDQVGAEVQKGRALLLFPEGTRSPDGTLGKMKSGAFVVAAKAGADIIPCIIRYSRGRPRLFCRIGVVFGPPVPLSRLGLDAAEIGPKQLRQARTVYREILQQLQNDYQDKL